jgi:ADP-heptose:LPS heptosyltransferase
MPDVSSKGMGLHLRIDKNTIKNVLIILPDMIGLNVLCMPALRQIIDCYQDKNIRIIGFNICSEIFIDENLPNLSLIKNQEHLNELSVFIKTNNPFDIVFDFLSSRESSQIVLDSGISYRLGWDYSGCTAYNVPVYFPARNRSTVCDYLEYLTAVDEAYCYERPQLTLTEGTKEQGRAWLQENDLLCDRLIVLGVGGGNNKKRWPLDNYLKLSDGLKSYGEIGTLFVVGPNELELCDEIRMADRGIVVARNLPLQTLKGVLSLACCTIANDYAVMHISAALGIPTIAVFLASDPVQWFPYLPPSQSVIGKYLVCRPCYSEDCVDWKCNDPLLFDMVMVGVKRILLGTAGADKQKTTALNSIGVS